MDRKERVRQALDSLVSLAKQMGEAESGYKRSGIGAYKAAAAIAKLGVDACVAQIVRDLGGEE